MSDLAPSDPPVSNARRAFVLVASQFNPEYVAGLINHCTDELRRLAPASTVTLYRVPGAFEIPVIVQEIASQKKADAIIALGVIVQGETAHAQHLGHTVTDGLQRITLETSVPVIHAVLSLQNQEQARARCLEEKMNRGTEAARVAVEMTDLLARLRK